MTSHLDEKLKRNTIHFLFQCFLCFLLSYSAFVSVYLSFFKRRDFSFLTLFFILPLVLFSVFSLYSIYKYGQEILSKDIKNWNLFIKRNKWLLAVLSLCFISLFIGFFNVWTQYSRGIFNDELTQFLRSTEYSNIIKAAYRQQQPPLDYYFSAFSSELWDQASKASIRFHAMFFYLILSFILPLGIYRFSSSFSITLVGTLLFLINHVVRLHSVYARPMSLALLTGFLFLFFYLSYCDKSRSERQSLFPVTVSQYLFVMSVSLQPVMFIVSLFLSSWLFLSKKTILKNLFLSHFITALLALPIFLYIYFFGQARYKFNTVSIDTIVRYISNYDIVYLYKKYFASFYEQLAPVFFAFLFHWLLFIFIRKKISNLTVMAVAASIFFILFYDFIFHTFISRISLNNRYIIVLSLLFIFFTVLALKEILQYLKLRKWKLLWITPMTILFCYAVYLQALAIKNKTQFHFPHRDNDIEEIYSYLQEKGNPNDLAIDFSLPTILDHMGRDAYLHKILFYKPNLHPKIILWKSVGKKMKYKLAHNMSFAILYINWKELSKKENQKIFFVVFNDETSDVLSDFIKGRRFGRYDIFELSLKEKDKEKEYISFLSDIIETTPRKQKVILYETLLYYACKSKNTDQFNQLLKEYKGLEPDLKEVVPRYNFPGYFELRRRVKYFESEDCGED